MKKILLFLFLLTSLCFYPQVSDIIHCSGDNNFDLSKQKINLIGNLNPAQTTVSYHLSLSDASNNLNAIANPSNYNTAASSTTIYARIDNNGTITTNSFNVKVTPALNITATNTTIECKGGTSSLTITASGGGGQYYYSINNGNSYTSSNFFNNLLAGVYNIQVLDAVAGCPTKWTYTITEPATLLNTTVAIDDQNAIITAIGGTSPYQYSLDGNNYQTSNVFPNLVPGNYIFRVRDSRGCVVTVSATMLPTLNASLAITKQLDCISKASIAINTTGGQPPYTYSLNGGVYQSSTIFNNLTAGNYYVTVKDAVNTISNTTSITIAPPVPVNGVAVHNNPTSCSAASITIIANTGQAPYYYSIDSGVTYSNMNTFNNLQSGTYIAFIKDSKSCVSPALFITIDPVQQLMLTTAVTNVNCKGSNDGSITINTTGGEAPYTYSIGNGYVSNNIFNNLSAGYYNVSVKDALGCLYTMAATIVEPTILSLTAVTTNSTTSADNDGTITVNAVGGVNPYFYEITDNTGLPITSFQTSNIFTGLKAGAYGVKVTDTKGCLYLQTNIVIANKANSLVATTAVTPITCLNSTGTIAVSVSGDVGPYQYSLDNGITYVSSNVFTGLAPGTYNIMVRDAKNNTTSIVTVIAPLSVPAISATVNSNVLCKGDNTGSITAIATSGQVPYTYSLDGITFNTSNVFTNLRVGTFNITVKDTNDCTATTTIALTEPAEDLSATAILINDQGIIVNAKGGTAPYLYYLQNNNGIVVAGPQTNGIFTKLPTGRYSAQVTDANGCGYIHWSVDILAAPTLSATADVQPITCIDAGTITVNAKGGFQPYYYSFDNGTTYTNSNVYSSFKPGSYTIKVRDYQNTTFSFVAMITEGSVPVINITATSINCKGEASGSITVNTTGGLTPYNYSLDNGPYINGKNNMTFTNLYAGSHNITVMDTNGCLTTNKVIISEPVSKLMTVTTVKNQTITINATGGVGNYRYSISPNLDKFSANNIFSGLTPGSYIVNTSDMNGCYIMMNAVVDPPAPLINGQIKLTLEFKPGQTLADLIIDGQNIKWYINQNPLAGKTNKTSQVSLPLTTVIVDGTTYYASQTINGIESVQRLAVTVKSSTLGINELAFKNFSYYPNPVKNVISISNDSIIDELIFISVKGETILTQKPNRLSAEIDLSNFSAGIYFLKVTSNGVKKTVKIIKN